MKPEDFFKLNPIVIELQAEERWAAIDELVSHLEQIKALKADQKDLILANIKQREAAMSTGIGQGVALPHAMTDLVSEPVVIIGRSRKGIEFAARDRKKVKIVALYLMPQAGFQKHLNTLADVAKLLCRKDFQNEL
jgi:mannitol/fructose-specific phosphotransferase system IIA component (Ntr-type)